jgi:hypothetical protein
MKKILPLLFCTAALSLLSGILMSKMSFIARTSMNIFRKKYQYYEFMRTWWQGALAVFAVLLLLLAFQLYIKRKKSVLTATLVQVCCFILALAGLYFTYSDFRHDLSHRWVGERFHLGIYIFWINWAIISMYILLLKKDKGTKDASNKPASVPQTTPYIDLVDDK